MSEVIAEVHGPERVEFQDGGSMDKFELTLESGKTAEAWRPVGGKFPPKVGDVGTLDGKKFSKTPSGGGGGGYSGGGGHSGGGGGRSFDPEREARIVRQHSQEMALLWGRLHPEDTADLDKLRVVIDWFQEDVGLTPPPAAPTSKREVHGTATTLPSAKAELVDYAAKQKIPLPTIARAVEAVTGTATLSEDGLPFLGQIKAKATEMLKELEQDTEEIPF